jgi:hypothetical protein
VSLLRGINYPWTIFDGRPNYGCDFGMNRWHSHSGVTAHLDEVRADFAAMAARGFEIVRWFVFTDGRGGIEWNDEGELRGLDHKFFGDMDAAVDIAANARVRLCLVLLDFSWLDDMRRVFAIESGAFADRIVDPVLDRYGDVAAIHSFDVINEPDWRPSWPLERLRAFVGDVARRIHGRSRALVTLGGARVSNVTEWDDPAYALDILQVHSYPDVRYPGRDASIFDRTAASLGVSKPVLIGECPSNPRKSPAGHLSPAYSLEDYLVRAAEAGYLGAWRWSFNGVDAFGWV